MLAGTTGSAPAAPRASDTTGSAPSARTASDTTGSTASVPADNASPRDVGAAAEESASASANQAASPEVPTPSVTAATTSEAAATVSTTMATGATEDTATSVSRGTEPLGGPQSAAATASPASTASTPTPSAPTGETVREVLEADMTDTPSAASAPAPRSAGFRTAGDIAAMGVGSDESTPLARSAEHALLVREGRRLGDPLPRPARTRVMVVANQKGGVGKTTTTVNMAAALAQHGLRVLVIDLDPQGNASTALSIDHHRGTPSTYDALVEGRPLAEVVQPSPEIDGLFVVPATIDLAGAEIELVSLVAREGRLRRAIHAHPQVFGTGEDRFDYVLIDCPPSLGLLTLNALVAGDEMLIPIQAEYYALEGLGQLLETVEMVKAHLNPT